MEDSVRPPTTTKPNRKTKKKKKQKPTGDDSELLEQCVAENKFLQQKKDHDQALATMQAEHEAERDRLSGLNKKFEQRLKQERREADLRRLEPALTHLSGPDRTALETLVEPVVLAATDAEKTFMDTQLQAESGLIESIHHHRNVNNDVSQFIMCAFRHSGPPLGELGPVLRGVPRCQSVMKYLEGVYGAKYDESDDTSDIILGRPFEPADDDSNTTHMVYDMVQKKQAVGIKYLLSPVAAKCRRTAGLEEFVR
eukprot:COSAG04_NODE_2691_length_3725_cov_211.624655_1_plen_254_part_00